MKWLRRTAFVAETETQGNLDTTNCCKIILNIWTNSSADSVEHPHFQANMGL